MLKFNTIGMCINVKLKVLLYSSFFFFSEWIEINLKYSFILYLS